MCVVVVAFCVAHMAHCEPILEDTEERTQNYIQAKAASAATLRTAWRKGGTRNIKKKWFKPLCIEHG